MTLEFRNQLFLQKSVGGVFLLNSESVMHTKKRFTDKIQSIKAFFQKALSFETRLKITRP